MPVGFGFSIGDVISGLQLLRSSIEAVGNVHGSSADYASLIAELESLSTALEAASDLTSEHLVNQEQQQQQQQQQRAINSAVKACQKCMDDFLIRIAQYQKHLKRENSGWRSCYMKIRWALCKQEDVAKLRAMLGSHTNSIDLLLTSYRTKEMRDLAKSLEQNQSLIQRGVEYEQVDNMSYMLQDISLQQRESFDALRQQCDRSVQAFEQVRSMLQAQQGVPPQIMLQQPVILLDACGRVAPFHLEFVDSVEAFVAVMIIRFKQAGISQEGLQKLANLEFTLRDTRRKRPIDLTKPWCSALKPGQLIDMNVLYPTITYRLARLSMRNRQLLCYNFYFPCLLEANSQPTLSDMATAYPHTERATRPAQSYDRLEEFQRVHLILRSEKQDDEIGTQVRDSALPDLMENVSEAFAIYWQHMVVTLDSTRTFDAKPQSTGSDLAVNTKGRSWRRDLANAREHLRQSLPSEWDVAQTEEL